MKRREEVVRVMDREKREAVIRPEFMDLVHRRTKPFLDHVGLDRSLSSLLREAYVQGMCDALDAIEHRDYP